MHKFENSENTLDCRNAECNRLNLNSKLFQAFVVRCTRCIPYPTDHSCRHSAMIVEDVSNPMTAERHWTLWDAVNILTEFFNTER